MQKVIITAAVCGSRPTKEMNPSVPYTPAEIADAAIACGEAGAAIAHIHVRDPETGAPSSDIGLFREVLHRIRDRSNMIVNLTTSGLNITGTPQEVIDRRLEPIGLGPEICSFDIGSMNFQDRPFVNSPDFGMAAAHRMMQAHVKPEIEVFDIGHVDQARHWIDQGLIAPPAYFQLCMGARWGIPATPENLLFLRRKLPAGAQWSVLGVGRHQLPMIAMGLILGGHIRVGFEDNLYLRKGVMAQDNAEMVGMAADLARSLQREVATSDEAREILGLT